MSSMNSFLLLIPLLMAWPLDRLPDEVPPGFAPGEMGPALQMIREATGDASPATGFSQSLQLHEGWNLVSWNIVPLDNVGFTIEMNEILPGPPSWLTDAGGKVYTWEHNDLWYPNSQHPEYGGWEWNPYFAYYLHLDSAPLFPWQFTNRPLLNQQNITMRPKQAWTHDPAIGEEAVRWFFLGYHTQGYMKLASIPNPGLHWPYSGNPSNFVYEGPLHNLIWDEVYPYDAGDLKIIKTDDGKCYVPTPTQGSPYDNIGVLQPGRGYFLGFYCHENDEYIFEDGWPLNPEWNNTQSWEPGPNPVSHFQFTQGTHWFYPVLIDTVDLSQTPLEIGDEVAAYDGDLCVGAVHYNGSFPLLLNSWQDDIATPDVTDGYMVGNSIAFKWYDASENTEAEFILPPGTMSLEDDPIAPTHSGFGRGAYASRSFSNGVQGMQQLPKEFKLGQNFPNPFNAETIIPLELPQRSHVKIELFNVRGQSLGVIFEGVENAGWPKIRYNASRLTSGMYFCRVTAEGLERSGKYQSVGKLLLLK
jgi:hypothetical protein